jgi:hypothetical protein
VCLWHIAGAPGWLESERYDVVGKAPAAGSEETFWRSNSRLQSMRLYYTDQTFRLMVQSLLADRFKLSVHMEQRPTNVYALANVDQGGMTIPAALEKLLGLKWEPRKQPMPAIVIDHIEKPSEN